jgi:hypothetical protein
LNFLLSIYMLLQKKSAKKAWGQHRRARYTWLGRLLIILAPFLLIVWFLW